MDVTSELAAALEADCTEVLGSYQRALDELGGPIAEDPSLGSTLPLTPAGYGSMSSSLDSRQQPGCATGSRVRNEDRPGGGRSVSGA
jgi:hypothetical protein